MRVGSDTDWAAVSAGDCFSLALKTNGSLYAWGYNSQGQLGDGSTANRSTPVQVAVGSHWTAISAGG